jgi:hypothetical protein
LYFCFLVDLVQFGRRHTQQHNTQHNTQLGSCLPHRCIEENTRISFTDYMHSPRAQALPSNTVSYKQESLIVPPVLIHSLSLSLSPMSSCSNELNHISDVAEDHEHGQTLCYRAPYSFLSFCLSQNLSLTLALLAICFCSST